MPPSRIHPTQLGNFSGNDMHPQPFDPAGYAGYAPPSEVPGQYHGYTYPSSSSSGYTSSAIAANAFGLAPPGYGGMPPSVPGSALTVPPREEPSRRNKLLKKLSLGLLRPTGDPLPSAPALTAAQTGPPAHELPTSRRRSKSNASQTQYQPISVEDFEAIVAETGSLSRYPALSLPGADGATHAHPHKRLPEVDARETRGRPSTRDMAVGGVMRNPSRTPKDDPVDSDTDSSHSSPHSPSFGSDKTRWAPPITPSESSHASRYPAASAPVGVGFVTHAAQPGRAYPESHKASIHSSWSLHGAAGRPRSSSYYEDPDHYTSYIAGGAGAPVPPGSASGHVSGYGVPPGAPLSHTSHLPPPPIATSTGSHRSQRHSHRHSVSGPVGVSEFGYGPRDGGREERRDSDRERDKRRGREGGSRRDDRRKDGRSRSRHSHHSQMSVKTYGSYSPVPFETPPAHRTRSLSRSRSKPDASRDDIMEPSGSHDTASMKPILKASSVRSQHSVAPSVSPSVQSTWSYHAPAPPHPPGIVGSSTSHHSTSPYTAPTQPRPYGQQAPSQQPQPYDNPYRTSPTLSSASPTHSRHGHRHSVSGPMMSTPGGFHDMQNHGAMVNPATGSPATPVAGGLGYYQYAGWNAPPPMGIAGSQTGSVPVGPGSAGGDLPPAQYAFIDHSRGPSGGHARSHGSSRSGSGELIATSIGVDRERSGRSRTHRGRSRSVDALEAARRQDYEDKMRILQAQGSTGSVGSRRQAYPPNGPYGVPVAYSASGHSHQSHSHTHSPADHRESGRERKRDKEKERDREREGRGRSKSRERNILRKEQGRSESRRRHDGEEDHRDRGRSRSRSRPRHREDFDERDRDRDSKRERRREHEHDHERHISVDEVMEIERGGDGRQGHRVLRKRSRSRPRSSNPQAPSTDASSSGHHQYHHDHHPSSASHKPSRHRHRHAHSALIGSSESARARHERRRESLEHQGTSHPRFVESAFEDPRRERETGMGVLYPVEPYPGREGSRERKERKERRKTVSGVPAGAAGWYPV